MTVRGHCRPAPVLSAFTFDNVPTLEKKVLLFRSLAAALKPGGVLVSVVSTPEIYLHEWASFSTKDFPENRQARNGDVVKIITTDCLPHPACCARNRVTSRHPRNL